MKTWEERNKWIRNKTSIKPFQIFLELEAFRETGLGNLVPLLNKTHKFKNV